MNKTISILRAPVLQACCRRGAEIRRAAMLLLAVMLTMTAQTAWADSAFSGGSGSKGDPYQIASTTDLNQLATDVNGGNDYNDKYFVLTQDITYAHGDSDTESNYKAIGGYDGTNNRYFRGTFDGANHTVSGIRIYKDGTGDYGYQGLFGQIDSPAEVKSVILADARITGYDKTGAIVGYIDDGNDLGKAASAVGYNDGTVANSGLALRANADNTGFLTLMAARTATLAKVDRTPALNPAANLALSGRTLYKDGSWNTLCLPFDESGTISGDNVQAMTLDTWTSYLYDGTLTLNFTAAAETIPAGTPFIIKWDESGTDIENPKFESVTVPSDYDTKEHITAALTDAAATIPGVLTFTGTYAPVSIPEDGDSTKLCLGAYNTLYYPNAAMTIGSQRAYFQLAEGQSAGIVAFVLNFGDDLPNSGYDDMPNSGDDEATGIITTKSSNSSNAWYTLDGRKLDKQPTASGVYIHQGKKVVVK